MDPLKKKRLLKSLLFHGILILGCGIGAYFYLPTLIFLNIFYVLYFAARIVQKVIKDQESKFNKYLAGFLMTLGMIPACMFGLVPAWLIGVSYENSHPTIRQNIKEYTIRENIVLREASTYRSYNSFYYEGKISEQDLLRLAQLQGWTLEKIQSPQILAHWAQHEIRRFRKQSGPDTLTVKNGLMYSETSKKGSGSSVIWDRENSYLYGAVHYR